MAHLYTWRAEPHYRIYGPEAGESGPWYCTCPNGRRHLGPRVEGQKPPVCKHLHELFSAAAEGFLSSKFTERLAGVLKTDAGCVCNGSEPLTRAIYVPPPAPIPGQPSRNRPCPCGSGELYKRCHGAEGGAPPGAPPMPGEEKPPEPAKHVLTTEEKREHRREQGRAARVRELEERAARRKRVDLAIENAERADEARRVARAKRAAEKKEQAIK